MKTRHGWVIIMIVNVLQQIADELHNLNINLVELIQVQKEKASPIDINNIIPKRDEDIELLNDVKEIHDNQLDLSKNKNVSEQDIQKEQAYYKKQKIINNMLRKNGIL